MTSNTINDAVTMRGESGSALGSIDKYELVRELGEGGFGAVYLAHDTVAKTDVAIKGLPPEVKHNASELELIRGKFALVSRLRHPSIAAVRDLHLAQDVKYLSKAVEAKLRVFPRDTMVVMDYVPGVTLAQWRRQFPGCKVPVGKAVEIARQIASALDFAHGQKVLHRDVKPANIMVETSDDGELTARVLDFGLAAEIRSSMGRVSREIRDTSGTRPYMAPEQWLGRRQGPATDQYSLAVLFYELVVGEVPFASVFDCGDTAVMRLAVSTDAPEIPQDLPKNVRRALAVALAKNPDERFASCGEFVAALGGKKASRGRAETRRPGGGGRLLAVVALIAALGGVGYFGWTKYDAMVKAREAEEARIAEGKAAEMARVRHEVYELKGKASQARDKNANEDWHKWPHFGERAKELEGAFRAGETALAKDDFEVARGMYLKVRDNWYWLSTNKVNRAKALAAKKQAEAAHKAAAAAEAGEFAKSEFEAMGKGLANAERAFSAARFLEAADRFGEVSSCLTNVVATARRTKKDTHARLALQAFKDGKYSEGFRYAQTADTSSRELQFFIGECHAKELGGATQDWLKAGKWYHESAKQDYAPAEREYGKCCGIGGRGFKVNEEHAFSWYKAAAEHGDPEAMELLGECYEKARGVAVDNDLAAKWYATAVEKGRKSALAALTRTDTKRALSAFKAGNWAEGVKLAVSADSDDGNLLFAMGQCYENGNGVAKNLEAASAYYAKSANAGVASAKAAWRRLDASRALAAFKEERWADGIRLAATADPDNCEIHFILGKCFEEGLGVQKNLAKAAEQYVKAATLRHGGAVAAVHRVGKALTTAAFEAKAWQRVLHFANVADTNDMEVARQIATSRKELERIGVERRYREALDRVGIDVDGTFPADRVIDVPAGVDLATVISNAPDKATLKLAAGKYSVAITESGNYLKKFIPMPAKNLRIVGVSCADTVIDGGFSLREPQIVVIENLAIKPEKVTRKRFWSKDQELVQSGIEADHMASLVVKKCHLSSWIDMCYHLKRVRAVFSEVTYDCYCWVYVRNWNSEGNGLFACVDSRFSWLDIDGDASVYLENSSLGGDVKCESEDNGRTARLFMAHCTIDGDLLLNDYSNGSFAYLNDVSFIGSSASSYRTIKGNNSRNSRCEYYDLKGNYKFDDYIIATPHKTPIPLPKGFFGRNKEDK